MNGHVVLSLWTDDPDTARRADAAGIDRIGVDLDRLGKAERQAGLATWISPHTMADLERLRSSVLRARLFVRTNPLHDGSPREIEQALAAGAQVLMLPMFRTADDVARFVELVARRAGVIGLLETREAAADVAAIVRVPGLDELHVGINDLALALGLHNRFAVLVSPTAERIAYAAAAVGMPLGFGGIGRLADAGLPIAPDLVYAQYPRLGATAALVARSFLAGPCDLAVEVRRSRERLAWWAGRPQAELDGAAARLADAVRRCPAF